MTSRLSRLSICSATRFRKALWSAAKSLLFRLDPERAHHLASFGLHLMIGLRARPILRIASGASGPTAQEPARVLGMAFQSRVGLAAGFDKDARMVAALPSLGFGFAEIGTVTPRPQPGNERPRLFRDPARRALFNRMGFNGQGAPAAAEALRQARPALPPTFRVGVNLGKNKDTPLEEAWRDYRDAAGCFEGLADYLVINVSSPNTPGLRSLQTLEALAPLISAVREATAAWRFNPPLLLKLAPELSGEDLGRIIESCETRGVQGWVLTNTLGGTLRDAGPDHSQAVALAELPGGWSGGPLANLALRSLQQARGLTLLPIISVGGILSAEEALQRRRFGADLVQIYTGWIYEGPSFPAEVARRLSAAGLG